MPLPMQVIGDMIGAPRSSHRDLLQWSNEAVATTDPEYATGPDGQVIAGVMIAKLFIELREAYRSGDGSDVDGDLIAVLTEGLVDGEPLSDVRFAMFGILLSTAGNETTRNAISHGVWVFAENPEQWQRLREDRSLLKSAVEEILRWSSPLLYFRRNAVESTEVGGETIEAGDIVSLRYSSANFDESVFEIGRASCRERV